MVSTDKIALVTGGSRGIGKAICELFAHNGIKVIAPSRAELDLTSDKSIYNYFDSLKSEIHILVNNAGINPLAEIGNIKFEDARQAIDINFWAPVIITDIIAGKMKKNGYGRIVNISSIWSIISKKDRGIYAASKAAINSFTRTSAVELAPYNILINAVAPGYVNTELTKQNNSAEQIAVIKSVIPLKRLAEPNELAELVHFLCSEKNSYLTGQTIIADGGFSIV